MQKAIQTALDEPSFREALIYIITWEEQRLINTKGSKVTMLKTLVKAVANDYKIKPSRSKI